LRKTLTAESVLFVRAGMGEETKGWERMRVWRKVMNVGAGQTVDTSPFGEPYA
jgi:hypothetical protein